MIKTNVVFAIWLFGALGCSAENVPVESGNSSEPRDPSAPPGPSADTNHNKGQYNLNSEDRGFLNENFKRYGSGWAGGLDALERDFEIAPESKRDEIIVHLTFREPPQIGYSIKVARGDGGMSTGRRSLPAGPELSKAELDRVDRILKRERELWFIEPPNSNLRIIKLSKGIADLRGKRTLETRRFDRRALLYMADPEGWRDTFCLWLNLDGGIEGLAWVEVPMPEHRGRWLSKQDVDFLDNAMRKNGDFGVYGNVQAGLQSLMTHMEVRLRETDTTWNVDASPRDGHGHFLSFPIDKRTGDIGDCAAGHLAPEPDDIEEPMPEE